MSADEIKKKWSYISYAGLIRLKTVPISILGVRRNLYGNGCIITCIMWKKI